MPYTVSIASNAGSIAMKFASNALDMRSDRVVVEYGLGGIHELLPVLYVTRVAGHRVDEPEFCQGQADGLFLPVDRHALGVDFQVAAHDDGRR